MKRRRITNEGIGEEGAEDKIELKSEGLTGHWGGGMLHNEDLHNFWPLQNIALNADMQSVSSRHAKCRAQDVHEKGLNE